MVEALNIKHFDHSFFSEINQETKQYKQKYDEVMEKKTSLYNTELHLGLQKLYHSVTK